MASQLQLGTACSLSERSTSLLAKAKLTLDYMKLKSKHCYQGSLQVGTDGFRPDGRSTLHGKLAPCTWTL